MATRWLSLWRRLVRRAAARGTLAGLSLRPGQYGLVTLHRPANVDDPAVLGALPRGAVSARLISLQAPAVRPGSVPLPATLSERREHVI